MAPNTSLNPRSFRDRDDSLLKQLGHTALHTLDALYGRFSKVGDTPVHDPSILPGTSRLEAHWTEIRDELDDLLRYRDALPNFHDVAEDASTISQGDDWKTFFLYGYGLKVEENCARCPRTTELIEQVPGMTTAFFSILSPGKHIPAHRGPYKGVLRYHLGLKVPTHAARCRIRVDDHILHWEEGRGIVFDDTYDHEVWNETEEERAILFLDVKRPMHQPLAGLNDLLLGLLRYTPAVQNARENQRQWTKRLAQMEQGNGRPAAPPPAEPSG